MTVLGIETSSGVCSAALWDDESGRFAAARIEARNLHAEKLVTIIDHLLEDSNSPRMGIEGIAVSIGPGSFTGLRIGLSVAKGIAYALGIPLAAVPTLKALALPAGEWSSSAIGPGGTFAVIPVVDARRDDVYCGIYPFRAGELLVEALDDLWLERAVRAEELLGHIEELHDALPHVVLTGDGTEKVLTAAARRSPAMGRLAALPRHLRGADALTVARLGIELIRRGDVPDLDTLEPRYLKEFVPGPTGVHSPTIRSQG